MSNRLPECMRAGLKLPLIAAPMFRVSGPDLALAACRAGVIGALPVLNSADSGEFEAWLDRIHDDFDKTPGAAPLAVNMPTAKFGGARYATDIKLLERYKVPVVITAIGDPTEVVQAAHAWGGVVLHDATTVAHAEKAAEVGVDGINVICGGAGGHAGVINPFAFLPQVRKFFDGIVCLAGSMSNGRSILAAQMLGADIVYMGTRFIATQESLAADEYKALLVSQGSNDVMYTDRIAGMLGNFLRSSMQRVGLDPDNLPEPLGPRQANLPDGIRPWRQIWSAGHGIGLIDDVPRVAELVQRLQDEYAQARAAGLPPVL
ncbi:MAG: nitronate monooxygenase [Pseudoxanthomonas sp.]